MCGGGEYGSSIGGGSFGNSTIRRSLLDEASPGRTTDVDSAGEDGKVGTKSAASRAPVVLESIDGGSFEWERLSDEVGYSAVVPTDGEGTDSDCGDFGDNRETATAR
jgi:hypothetical protein